MSGNGQTRRNLMRRGLIAAGAAIGLGAGAGAGTVLARDAAAPAAPPRQPRELAFQGRNWVLQRPNRRPGEALAAGDLGAVYGELWDREGTQRGRFVGSRLAVQSAVGGAAFADAGLELHTLELDEGTLLGLGLARAGESVFAIVGGTGAFAGAQGTYVAKQLLREQGGDGTAEFNVTLTG